MLYYSNYYKILALSKINNLIIEYIYIVEYAWSKIYIKENIKNKIENRINMELDIYKVDLYIE